ncbi:hypothetical protein EJ110_NYTH02046 [Nymphaea thermarum]|nr:hypothetical protein EJ110_NYTH02046 [Nymphaea thermarum]
MSSPARSSVSASNAVMGDESPFLQFHEDIVSAQDCKLEAMTVLKSDVMAALHKEVKSLDEDSWMFSGPRSKIHLEILYNFCRGSQLDGTQGSELEPVKGQYSIFSLMIPYVTSHDESHERSKAEGPAKRL